MKKILLVEDDHYMRDLYQAVIVGAGYKVNVAADAQTALDILDEYGADLIIVDIFLPFHNGIELMQELQSHSDWQDIPVIVISTLDKESFGAAGRAWKEYGAAAYFDKTSMELGELVKNIQALL